MRFIALSVAAVALIVAGNSVATATPNARVAKTNRVTLSVKQSKDSLTASGVATRKGRPAANVVVTLTGGLAPTALTAQGADRTGSDGRYSVTISKKGFLTSDSSGPISVYFRTTTSFAKSGTKRVIMANTEGD
jgi:5-hydroxyisourate hydrolase-like protein (transthyretin family)